MMLRQTTVFALAVLIPMLAARAQESYPEPQDTYIEAQEMYETELASYDTLLQRVEQLESEVRLQPAVVSSLHTEALESQVAAQASSLRKLRKELRGDGNVGGWFANYENLILKPTLSNSTAFIAMNDPNFDHMHFDWNLEYSPRVELGYMAGSDGLGWRARYWHFRHHTAFYADEANGLIPTDEGIVGFFSEDGDIVVGLSDVDAGIFANAIRTDVIDLELEKATSGSVSYLAGLRYAQLRQQYFADTNQGLAQSSTQFHGLGPTVAMDLQHLLSDNISLYGTVRGSLLYGTQSFVAWDDVNNMRLNALDEEAFASNGEIKLGVRLALTNSLSMNFGVEAQHWADVGGANPSAFYAGDDLSVDSDSPSDDNLSFIGMNIGAALHW